MRDLVLDFETYYDKDFSLRKMTTMEYVADDRFHVWGVGFKWLDQDATASWYGPDETEEVLGSIDWSDTNVICHRAHFDAYILNQHYEVRPGRYSCTEAMSRAVWPNNRANLKMLLERLFPDNEELRKGDELELAKGIRDLPPDIEHQVGNIYCVNDVEVTASAYKELVRHVPEKERDLINMITRMFVEPALILDRPRVEAYRIAQHDSAEAAITASGIEQSVLASNKQFKELMEELELEVPWKENPKGDLIPALGKSDIGFNRVKLDNPEHKLLWDARTAAKSRIGETRAQRFLDVALADGRIPMPLKFSGAHTHRLSGQEKMNVQNMTRGSELRYSLMAPDGQYVYVGDLSQIEVRLNAWLASEMELLQAFREGRDIYSEFASNVYGRIVHKKNDPLERFVGKTCILGLGYNMGPPKFRDTLLSGSQGPVVKLEIEEAMRIVRLYRTKYPRITAQWRTAKGWIYNMLDPQKWGTKYGPLTFDKERIWGPNGLALHYPNLRLVQGVFVYDSASGPKRTYGGNLVENIIQFLARIVIMEAALKADEYFHVIGYKGIVLQVHDENVALGPMEDAEHHMAKFLEILTTPPEWCHDAPLAAEGGYDVNYSK